MTPYRISLLGTSFTIQSDEDSKSLDRLVALLKERIAQLSKTIPLKENLKMMIICSLILTEELEKAKKQIRELTAAQNRENSPESERITSRIFSLLDSTLKNITTDTDSKES